MNGNIPQPRDPRLRAGLEVHFKDEDGPDDNPIGPVIVIDPKMRADDPKVDEIGSIPFGYEPEWLLDMGWMSRSEAAGIALWCGTELQES